MGDKSLQEALYLYEKLGNNCIHEINRISIMQDYSDDVDQSRLKEKIMSYTTNPYGQSPEEIVLQREKNEVILHFIDWVKIVVQTMSPHIWEIWKDRYLFGKSSKQVAREWGVNTSYITHKCKQANRHVRNLLPLYNKEYGSIKEYLEE